MKKVNLKFKYWAFLVIWAFFIGIISSIMFYPINYFSLKFDIKHYFFLYMVIFMGSGLLIHVLNNMIYNITIKFSEKRDKFRDFTLFFLFSISALVVAFIIYMYSGSLAYGFISLFVYIGGGYTWGVPLLEIIAEIEEREEKYNKIFIDENGHKHLRLKL